MHLLVAAVALVGLVQAVVWLGQAKAPGSRRELGAFAAPIAFVLVCLALISMRMPALLW